MPTTVELKVRFNEAEQQIEVVANDEVLGFVEKEVWSQWPFALSEDKVKETVDEVVVGSDEDSEESQETDEDES